MVDIRYHLATIVGLFLALGLGMLIGMQLTEQGALTEEQLRLAERIEEGLERLRAENRRLTQDVKDLQAQLQNERQFAEMTFTAVVGGALGGQRVTVYGADASHPGVQRVVWVLNVAGADVDARLLPSPPEPGELAGPYVLVWSDAWGTMPDDDPWPPGGVVAHAWSDTGDVLAAGSEHRPWVNALTPSGLLHVVQRLSGQVAALEQAGATATDGND